MSEELPIPFARFAVSLIGTEEEVFIGLLKAVYGSRNFTSSEWRKRLDETKSAKI